MPEPNLHKGAFKETEPTAALPFGNSYLLAIGINDYAHFAKLNNAVKDVQDFATLLAKDFGFQAQAPFTRTLLDGEATRRGIINSLKELCAAVKPEDRVLIYYSGHGHLDPVTKLGYWIPINAERDDEAGYLPNSNVRDYLKAMPARHILLISDSCFSGELLVRDASRRTEGVFADWERQASRWVFCSGKGVVSDGKAGTNSPFAAQILRCLREDAAAGPLNLVRLADEVTRRVRYNDSQQAEACPLFGVGHEGGQFIFYPQKNEASAWQAALGTGTAAAFGAFLEQHPKGQFATEAQARKDKLEEAERLRSAQQAHDHAYSQALKSKEIKDLWAFLKTYPDSPKREEVRRELRIAQEEAAWKEAKRGGTLADFDEFLEKYPGSRYADDARLRIADLEAKLEGDDWEQAKRRGKLADFEDFLEKHPDSPHAEDARRRIAALKPTPPKPAPKEDPPVPVPAQASSQVKAEPEPRTIIHAAPMPPPKPQPIVEVKPQPVRVQPTPKPIVETHEFSDYDSLDPAPGFKWRIPAGIAGALALIFIIWQFATGGGNDAATQVPPPAPEPSISATESSIEMVKVTGGTFQMGDTFKDKEAGSNEQPVHSVTLRDFSIGKYEVTQKQWRDVMGSNPSNFKDCDQCPVENVSWNDVQDFLKKLNEKTGKNYRLPTEAEWEYAARGGGKKVRFGNGKDIADPKEINFNASEDYKTSYSVAGTYRQKTTPAGSLSPANALGLYDMSGNVWEWCSDWYDANYYKQFEKKTADNPTGPTSGTYRVLRGGSWDGYPELCRSAFRYGDFPDLDRLFNGFRVAQD